MSILLTCTARTSVSNPSSATSFSQRWDALFKRFKSLEELKQAIKAGDKLCEDGLRSVWWKVRTLDLRPSSTNLSSI